MLLTADTWLELPFISLLCIYFNCAIIIILVTSAALLTVDSLVIKLKDVQNWFQLGELLKMDEDVLKSIDDYYSNKGESFLYHLISNWFRDGPEEPLKLLIAGLRSLGEDDIATAISQLFSFGMNSYSPHLYYEGIEICCPCLSSTFMYIPSQ